VYAIAALDCEVVSSLGTKLYQHLRLKLPGAFRTAPCWINSYLKGFKDSRMHVLRPNRRIPPEPVENDLSYPAIGRLF